MDNFMTLKIKAVSRNESFARSAVAAFCVELNPTLDDLSDIKTAVSEAVTNSIVHGYEGEDGIVTIQAGIDGNVIHIEVSDEGKGIEDISMARQPFFTTKPDAERSGMGFTVMESFMDTLEVFHNAPHGTVVKMSKNLCAVK